MKLQKIVLIVFLIIVVLTSLLTLAGIAWIWFSNKQQNLPYLKWLIAFTLVEICGVIYSVASGKIKLLSEEGYKMVNCKTDKEINKFLRNFISRGTRVDIFSGKLSWVAKDQEMKQFLINKSKTDQINIFLPEINSVAKELKSAGINIYEYERIKYVPNSRFTLLNRGRPGGEVLAISKGTLPNHRIVEYDSVESPMLIAAASDLVYMIESLTINC